MKKTITILSAVAFLAACGNNSSTEGKTADSTTAQEQPKAAEDPEVEKGLNLIAQSDCLTCHQVETKSTGPAYVEVAAKYPGVRYVRQKKSRTFWCAKHGNSRE